jgi:CheY-like chemotaxis protein
MEVTSRTLLVVEDNRLLNQLYKNVCELAIYELLKEGLLSRFTIKQAHTYTEASNILKGRQEPDFMSVDLSLQDYGPNSKERDQATDTAIDGMVLLQELRENKRRTLAIIVSGEGLPPHSMDMLRKYRVLAYFEKSRLDLERYKHALKAALWYGEADRIIRAISQDAVDPGKLGLADIFWKKAVESTRKAGIDTRNLPENLGSIIESIRHAYADPIAQLSNDYLDEQELKEKAVGGK